MARFVAGRFHLISVLLFVFISQVLTAQVPDPLVAAQAPQPGSEHSYIGMRAETLNPADGQVYFDLPIHTPAGRGLSFPFGIRYSDSENYYLTVQSNNTGAFQWVGRPADGVNGWSYDLPYLTAQTQAVEMWLTTINGNPPQFVQHQSDGASNFVFRGFDGQQYALMLAGGNWNDAAYQGTNTTYRVSNYPYDAVTTSNKHGILATYPSGYVVAAQARRPFSSPSGIRRTPTDGFSSFTANGSFG